eukprot:gene14061-16623_t
MWLEAGVPTSELCVDFATRTQAFIHSARADLHYQTFVAVDAHGEIIGSLGCQQWAGPVPLSVKPSSFNLGSVWGVYVHPEHRKHGVATALMQHCIEHWRTIGCLRGILLYASEEGRRVYERLGFGPGNAMVLDGVQSHNETGQRDAAAGARQSPALPFAPGEPCEPGADTHAEFADARAASSAAASGAPAMQDQDPGGVVPEDAIVALRARLGSTASPSCHTHSSERLRQLLLTVPLQQSALYGRRPCDGVNPELRSSGTSATHLERLRDDAETSDGCSLAETSSHQVSTLAQELAAIVDVQKQFGLYVDPMNNWFTQNLHRFGGGFDMSRWDAAQVAHKFDRLSRHWEDFVTGSGYAAVFNWLVQQGQVLSIVMDEFWMSLAELA